MSQDEQDARNAMNNLALDSLSGISEKHQQLAQAWAVFDELLQDHNRTYRYALRLEIAARAVVQDAKQSYAGPSRQIRALEAALGET